MTRLLKDGLCIKVTFMHNGCWVNYYEKHSLRWHICLTINQTTWLLWIMSSSWFDSILNLTEFDRRGKVTLQFWLHFFSTALCFSNVASNRLQMCPQTTCLRRGKVTLVAFVWLFSTVRFQMYPQMTCPRRGIVTLVAFVRLFSTVHFQMCPQAACLRGCIVTLVAFI